MITFMQSLKEIQVDITSSMFNTFFIQATYIILYAIKIYFTYMMPIQLTVWCGRSRITDSR